jgi:peptide chain release factor subunit 3
MLAKTQGVNKLIVVVNKCDDPTVNWSQDRFQECTVKLVQVNSIFTALVISLS